MRQQFASRSDAEMLARDWQRVGQSLQTAMDTFQEQERGKKYRKRR